MEEPQTTPSDSDHYRDMARKLRELRVNFVSPVRAESCLILPRDTSDGPMAWTHGTPPPLTKIIAAKPLRINLAHSLPASMQTGSCPGGARPQSALREPRLSSCDR
jgi:hypothetical protein